MGRGADGRRGVVPRVPAGPARLVGGTLDDLDGFPAGNDRVIDGGGPHLRRASRRTEAGHVVGEPLGVDGVLVEDRGYGAHRLARTAVDAFVRLDVEHPRAFVDAVDGTLVDAGAVLHVDARLADRVGHRLPLFTFCTVRTGEILPRGA